MENTFLFQPDYGNSIVSVIASVQKHFGIAPFNPTVPELDALLDGNYRNVVLLVLDGLGSETLSEHLSNDSFLSRHKLKDVSSVFPTSTVASTTSIQTGLTPLQHGLLGTDFLDTETEQSYHLKDGAASITDLLGLQSAFKKIKGAKYHELSPFMSGMFRSAQLADIGNQLPLLCEKRGKKLIFAYSDEPDRSLHDYGIRSSEACLMIESISNFLEQLRRGLDDTLLIIMSDHGHTELTQLLQPDQIEGLSCTLSRPSVYLDPRATGFYVKDDCAQAFTSLMQSAIGDKGVVLPRSEAEYLFGTGEKHPLFDRIACDYIVVMTADIAIWNNPISLKAAHGGLTQRELSVPLIAASCPKQNRRK